MAIYYKGERLDGGTACAVALDYTGDGAAGRSFEFPRKPAAVYIRQMNGGYEMYMAQGEEVCRCRGPSAYWPNHVEWTGNSVSWSMAADTSGRFGLEYQCNQTGRAYRLIAFLAPE